jgi:hypothetical protein
MPRTRCTCGGTGADGCRPRRRHAVEDPAGVRQSFAADAASERVERVDRALPTVLSAARCTELLAAPLAPLGLQARRTEPIDLVRASGAVERVVDVFRGVFDGVPVRTPLAAGLGHPGSPPVLKASIPKEVR